MRDLTSSKLIVTKGALFFGVAVASAALILLESPTIRNGILVAVLVWSSCRFYYFLFHVLEKYVDKNRRYAGLMALVGTIWRRRRQ
jgi:hypothetical protein